MHPSLRHLRRAALVALGLPLALAAPAAAHAQTLSSQRGDLRATLVEQAPHSGLRAHITITQAGRVLYRAPVGAPGCRAGCRLAGRGALSVARLGAPDGTAQTAVVLQLVSGDNGCCALAEVFTYDARRHREAVTTRDFGVGALALRDLGHDGREEFVSADGSFSARFTDAAMSGLPVQVWAWSGNSFVNDTLAYPHLIAADAHRWLTAYRAAVSEHDSLGFFAAWAADEDELGGMDASVDPFLAGEVANGDLTSPAMSGARFATLLPAFLSAHGYVPMCGGA